MSQRVRHGGIYETGRDYGNGTHSVNRTGLPFYLCDCCESRQRFDTLAAADRHEGVSAANTSAAEMGIYPGPGEELSDYLRPRV